jgi:hypothetical protein
MHTICLVPWSVRVVLVRQTSGIERRGREERRFKEERSPATSIVHAGGVLENRQEISWLSPLQLAELQLQACSRHWGSGCLSQLRVSASSVMLRLLSLATAAASSSPGLRVPLSAEACFRTSVWAEFQPSS